MDREVEPELERDLGLAYGGSHGMGRQSGGGWNERGGGAARTPGWSSEGGYGGWMTSGRFGTSAPHELRGPHAGKGPKGYQRSDERIREDVCDRLEEHPHIDATDIEVSVEDGIVTLSGAVEDRRTKRMAEDIIEHLPGVKDVNNLLRLSHGRIDQALSDLSASGTASPRRTSGAGGSLSSREKSRLRKR